MSRIVILPALTLGLLSACSQSPADKITSSCIDAGRPEAECSCIAEKAVDEIPADKLDIFLVFLDEDMDQEARRRQISKLSLSDAASAAAFAERAIRACVVK